VESIAPAGAANSLAQTLLKLTCPGVPDIYQGAEGWDLSLVDPDNRRAVDYSTLAAGLAATADAMAPHLANWRDGRIKQALIGRALDCVRDHEGLFTQGGYRELRAAGARGENVFAFARAHQQRVAVVATPRLMAGELVGANDPGAAAWGDANLALEGEAAEMRAFTEVLSGRTLAPDAEGRLELAAVFADLPVALLVGRLTP
jgi:maltooligosyltrehalose synthase